MPAVHVEALIFALSWAALAVVGAALGGLYLGAVLTLGILVVVMGTSSLVLSRTGDLALERQVRWGVLVVAALALFLWLRFQAAQ